MFEDSYFSSLGLADVRQAVLAGRRLSLEQGERLFACPDVHAVASLAMHRRVELHGDRTFYVLNRHINYTNVCVNRCRFCAFSRTDAVQEGAFLLQPDDMLQKIAQHVEQGMAELHMVGGCHPDLRLAFFTDLLAAVRSRFPALTIKAFTMVEIAHFARLEGISIKQTLLALKEAGLDMLPGGGAEIFAPEIRNKLCPDKLDGQGWLDVARQAHQLGIRSNATMLFGHIEGVRHRLEHLDALRRLQDETGGFTCFIPLPFLAQGSALRVPAGKTGPHTGLDELRTIAVSRLMLDNISHIKAYWVMLGVKAAQAALHFGADDLDGTVVEEKIGHMAGADSAQALSVAELEAMIEGSGFKPVRRNGLFQPIATADESKEQQTCTPQARSSFSESTQVHRISEKVVAGGRLDRTEALTLYSQAGLFTLGRLAHAVRLAKHPQPVVTYVVDRNINYSNICACGCTFCAFFAAPGTAGGYVLSREELAAKIEETLALGGRQILLQGGHQPDLPLSFYEEMLRFIKRYPIHVHAFSPPEIVFFAEREGLEVAEVLRRLREAGLDSIPGGGAEILVDRVRRRIAPNKCGAGQWLAVMEAAHRQGMLTTATMMFGHVETAEDRVEHLLALRSAQDRVAGQPGRYTAFIPWAFQPQNTALASSAPHSAPSPAYLRLLALSRIVLDNFDNIQASWVTMGPKVAQLALFYGANDLGSTMLEENVVAAAGVSFRLGEAELQQMAGAAGFSARRRRMDYSLADEVK